MGTMTGQPSAMAWVTMNPPATTTAGGDPVITQAHHRAVGMNIRRNRIHIQPITQHHHPDPFRRFQPSRTEDSRTKGIGAADSRTKGVRAVTSGRLELSWIPIAITTSYLASALGSFSDMALNRGLRSAILNVEKQKAGSTRPCLSFYLN